MLGMQNLDSAGNFNYQQIQRIASQVPVAKTAV